MCIHIKCSKETYTSKKVSQDSVHLHQKHTEKVSLEDDLVHFAAKTLVWPQLLSLI